VLEAYFPILIFIVVGLGVGFGPLLLGSIPVQTDLIPQKTLLMNAALKHLKMLE
jgi:hypothetical protein